ncbi:hypothetical protein GCM10011608_12210 [Micromonospora sonchi]|uniref:ATP/GTP-binding protein n=1 Tax=Micromonospora sonchi TaxID=1763543 RepID=A0A917TNE1_9ACTN|nr:hypothetical protein GCM10011608_12210 [Micromonospora sonchi]
MQLTKWKSRPLLIIAIGFSSLILLTPTAHAGDGIGGIDCSRFPHAQECTVSVGTPGGAGTGNGGVDNGGGGSGSGGGEESKCRYERLEPQAPAPSGAGGGAWYQQICQLDQGGVSVSQAMWLAAGQVADPQALGQVAVSRLRLPAPGIRTNPEAASGVLVQVPVWLWVDGPTWGVRRATASVPGMSVTATATPVRVVWSPGDGTGEVVCQGPGLPWRAGTDPRAVSSCGHTYRVSSAGAPGAVFTLRATVTWLVSWAGGGQSGTVPPLTTTSSVALPVAQSQAIVAG